MGDDSQGFETLERICKDSQDFGRGFARIHESLGEDLQGHFDLRLWERICKDCKDKTLGEDLQGFVRLWERILQGFVRLWERISKDL